MAAESAIEIQQQRTSASAIEGPSLIENESEDGESSRGDEAAATARKKSRPPPIDTSAAQNASPGQISPTSATPRTPRPSHERERKIGHRRVDDDGQITYKKIQTSQIMGSIQLGIGHSIGRLASKPERDLLIPDFALVETSVFPKDGSSSTPAHHYPEFKFKNYAPVAFRYFRDLFGIQPDDFLLSICNFPLIELTNPGASGSIFYLTGDDEFIIKTVQHKEGEFLQKLLPGYYMNLNQNPRTLLPKFFGLYCFQCGGKNVRLVVMNNLLPFDIKMHQKYDLKGSTYKRKAAKGERSKASPTFKDLDFLEHHPEGLLLEVETYQALIKTIQRDCRVLESFKIMDYSLLVGIHNLDQAAMEKRERRRDDKHADERLNYTAVDEADTDEAAGFQSGAKLSRSKSMNRQRLVAHTGLEAIQAESEPIDEQENIPPGGIPARNAKGERLLLYIGIIDILQSYRLKKKLEHTWKAMLHDGDSVSVHRPGFYSQRFQDFMAKKVFTKIPSLDLPEFKGPHRRFRALVSSYIGILGLNRVACPNPNVSNMFCSVDIPLKHSPSRKKSLSMRHRPPSMGEDGHDERDVAAVILKESAGPVSSTPPPSFEEAVRGDKDSAGKRSGCGSVLETTVTQTSEQLTVADRSDVISISQVTVKAESTLSTQSIVSESSSTTSSGFSSAIRTSNWTPPRSVEGSTPTHTEGTPSFTESSSSGDLGCPTTPVRTVVAPHQTSLTLANTKEPTNRNGVGMKPREICYKETEMGLAFYSFVAIVCLLLLNIFWTI